MCTDIYCIIFQVCVYFRHINLNGYLFLIIHIVSDVMVLRDLIDHASGKRRG